MFKELQVEIIENSLFQRTQADVFFEETKSTVTESEHDKFQRMY